MWIECIRKFCKNEIMIGKIRKNVQCEQFKKLHNEKCRRKEMQSKCKAIGTCREKER